ncbi:MAG: hypothetical protein M1832_004135 [Thelocarpon impressellum]|nr:MAG: hypothetical protein M1832_004135 [Thelocarpon impressellum]
MRASLYAAAAALLACAVSAKSRRELHPHHMALHEREHAPEATCGCTTYVGTSYGEATLYTPTFTAPQVAALTSTHVAPSSTSTCPTTSSSLYSAPSSSSLSSSSSSSSSPSSSSPSSSSPSSSSSATYVHVPTSSSHSASSSARASASASHGPVGGGDQWCMTYSPYTPSGGCKGAGEVAGDIAEIAGKGFKSIRLYSTDCSGLQNVGNACEQHGLKLVAGVFISETGMQGAAKQVEELIEWGRWSLVEMVVLGNEALFNKRCSAAELAAFISATKEKLRKKGYFGPSTTTEPLNVLQEHKGALCGALDVVAANVHPFFNAQISAAEAGDFAAKQLKAVADCCPGLTAYNLETGWPSGGQANGKAVPGAEQQRQAIEAIRAAVGGKSAFFSYIDDKWKHPGEFGVEQKFGCGHLF